MRSQDPDRKKAIKLLEQDLRNGPLHCFGYHDKCSIDFCKVARQRKSLSQESVSGSSSTDANNLDDAENEMADSSGDDIHGT